MTNEIDMLMMEQKIEELNETMQEVVSEIRQLKDLLINSGKFNPEKEKK